MADVQITLTIPDQYVSRIQTALHGLEGKTINIIAHDPVPIPIDGPCQYKAEFTYEGLTPKNIIRALIKALVEAYEYGEDLKRYRADVNAIPEVAVDIPDDIVG